jgi:hypothetical protein
MRKLASKINIVVLFDITQFSNASLTVADDSDAQECRGVNVNAACDWVKSFRFARLLCGLCYKWHTLYLSH